MKHLLNCKASWMLKKFGLIPELIGRFPVLTYLHPLDETAYVEFLPTLKML